ncbi:hypothetical protein SISNIDRAFT_526239 [Sistotremastrum niveocremeum HHB9708]|uniref:Uncharacterized protein n=1 Tax=Sistotremastrum niveocremeum HHB9708 TaxID=1314777 RepID=A0A164QND7_9AGAM|nr:hypothetical protein SISNIDRAFT_526239 [Sistotremastrum niveocremeum HHB9708]
MANLTNPLHYPSSEFRISTGSRLPNPRSKEERVGEFGGAACKRVIKYGMCVEIGWDGNGRVQRMRDEPDEGMWMPCQGRNREFANRDWDCNSCVRWMVCWFSFAAFVVAWTAYALMYAVRLRLDVHLRSLVQTMATSSNSPTPNVHFLLKLHTMFRPQTPNSQAVRSDSPRRALGPGPGPSTSVIRPGIVTAKASIRIHTTPASSSTTGFDSRLKCRDPPASCVLSIWHVPVTRAVRVEEWTASRAATWWR